VRVALLAVIAALGAACSPSPPPPRARSMVAAIAEKWPVLKPPTANVSEEKRRFKDAPVYIDGRRVGVIRPLEVPAKLKPRMMKRPGHAPVPRFSIAEYIEAAGGDLAKVREVHLYGGRTRISVVSGDELRKHRENLFFSFTGGSRGKPRIGWPENGIETHGGSIDIVVAVAVYIEKEPPVLDEKEGVLRFSDGKAIEGIPYAPNEELKGTRFYVDGALAGWMKRKTLPNSVLVPGADITSGRFSLGAFVASLGVDLKKVRAIELLQEDDAVARLDGSALSKDPPIAFTLPRRSQGNILLWLPPSTFQSPPPGLESIPVRISAVQLFLKVAPPTRKYVPLADVIEPEGKDRDQDRGNREPGSGGNQGDPEN
jgi:hypothetical protein